jgi:two-component system cell cycle response regulator
MSTLVLIVDDNVLNVKALEGLLRVRDYEVTTAFDGHEALAKIDQHRPDIVLLDVMMPEMNGYDVCLRIRQNPATAELPVIMVTALDKDNDRQTGMAAGADEFLTKPVDMDQLVLAMRSLMERGNRPSAKAS